MTVVFATIANDLGAGVEVRKLEGGDVELVFLERSRDVMPDTVAYTITFRPSQADRLAAALIEAASPRRSR